MHRWNFAGYSYVVIQLALWIGVSGFATAQNTWIVDAASGPGANFTDLPAAVAAAADGDEILVRAGVYGMTTVTKALRITGEPGAELRSRRTDDVLRIQGLPAGRTATLAGFVFTDANTFFNLPEFALVIRDCLGEVHLDQLVFVLGWRHFAISITRSAAVTAHRVVAQPGAYVESSHANFTDCVLWGKNPLTSPLGYVAQGLSILNSIVELDHCDVLGSDGGGHAGSAQGIVLHNSTLYLRGDATSRVSGGDYAGTWRSPAIEQPTTNPSVLIRDPAVTLIGAVQNVANESVRRMPTLRAIGGDLGGVLTPILGSAAGDPFLVLGGLPVPAISLPSLGELWLDAGAFFVVASGAQVQSEVSSFPQSVPNWIELRGHAIGYQALSQSASGIELSNAVVLVLQS